jgi:hypothetical protein
MKTLQITFVSCLLLCGCMTQSPVPADTAVLTKLFLSPKPDTIFISATDKETKDIGLNGIYLNKTEKTVSNSGLITHAEFTVTTIDSLYRQVNVNDAQWFSSTNNVIMSKRGTIRAELPGIACIWAECQGIWSDTIVVSSRVRDVAPGLVLNPSDDIFTFQNSVQITGTVQLLSRLRMQESNSGFTDTNVLFDLNGNFNRTVSGLKPGKSTIVVKAFHNTRDDLVTTRTRTVYYFDFGTIMADSIVGRWSGECGGKAIVFTISKNQYLPRYDISGTIDVQCYGYGIIQDVLLWGIVNNDGSMNLSATKEFDGFTVSGALNGRFQSTGYGKGTISGSLKKAGWIDFPFNESWWAKKQ